MQSKFEKREDQTMYAHALPYFTLAEVIGGSYDGYVIARIAVDKWVAVHVKDTSYPPFHYSWQEYGARHLKVRILEPGEKVVLQNKVV